MITDQQAATPPTLEELRGALSEMIDLWTRREATITVQPDGHFRPLAIRIQIEHSITLTRSILALEAFGLFLACVPSARLTIECALTAEWLRRNPQTADAAAFEAQRQRRNAREMFESLLETGFRADGDTDLSPEAQQALKDVTREQKDEARYFIKMCGSLGDGEWLYAFYRLLSEQSHAGPALLSQYLIPMPATPEAPLGFGMAPAPGSELIQLVFGTQATILLYALTTRESLFGDTSLSSILDAVAARIGARRELSDPALCQVALARRLSVGPDTT